MKGLLSLTVGIGRAIKIGDSLVYFKEVSNGGGRNAIRVLILASKDLRISRCDEKQAQELLGFKSEADNDYKANTDVGNR